LPWFVPLLAAAGSSNPLDAAVSQILGYGILGIVALALALRFLVPKGAVEDARNEARADLISQVGRLEKQIEELRRDKKAVEEQRDDAQQFTTSQLVPLLVQFTGATSALIPLLQELVRNREAGHSDAGRRQQ
jgi:hypothetical protein